MANTIHTSDVFGVSTNINSYSYVDRRNLDSKLRRYLRRNVHIAIKGPSKCGKSWLRQKCMENAIVVQCRLGMTVDDIYKSVLSSIGVEFDMSVAVSKGADTNLEGQLEAKLPGIAKSNFGVGTSFSCQKAKEYGQVYSNSSTNLKFIAEKIRDSKCRIVIEDFHYLDLTVRNILAHDLKTFWDYSCYWVIIGVWTQTNLLTSMNPDLTGRIEEIPISWSDEELLKVIDQGSDVLNIEIDRQIKRDLIQDSFGNVGILQGLLLRVIEDEANIEEQSPIKCIIANPNFYQNAAKNYATQLDGLYQQFAQTLSAGIRRRKQSTGIYALAMEAIVNAADEKLMVGYSRSDIFEVTNAKEPRIKKGNLKTVLGKLVELQNPETGRGLVISYDDSIDAIFVVDLQFLFYRKHHTMQWPWEEMAEEARQFSLFESEDE